MPRTGVLITGFGGPDCLEAVGPFMCNLMGREPTGEMVARICARYEAIGGSSPLVRIARDLAEAVVEALTSRGHALPVEVGMRYWDPFVADAVERLVTEGVTRIVLVTLSPFETQVTHGEYRAALDRALQEHPEVATAEAPLLSQLPAFAALHAEAASSALRELGVADAAVVFSAHSLPLFDVAADDRYVRGLEAAADAVAASLGLPEGIADAEAFPGVVAYGSAAGGRPWLLAFQSKGVRGGEWLGPDTDDAIGACAASGCGGVVVVPLGFATDHMETLYDLDVVAAARAADAGIAYARSAVPNADPRLASAIAEAVLALG
jgi:ferrochelatase